MGDQAVKLHDKPGRSGRKASNKPLRASQTCQLYPKLSVQQQNRLNSRRGTFVDPKSSGPNGQTKSDMMISFSHDDATYTAGERIEGQVTVVLTQDVKIKDLMLKVQGFSRVSWKEEKVYFRGSTTVGLKNSDQLLDLKINLLKRETNPSTAENGQSLKGSRSSRHLLQGQIPQADETTLSLGPGCYTFPFHFILARDLPGTFSGRWGQIKYTVKAALIRPWKFDVERETELVVRQRSDLNDEPELARPIGALGECSAGWLCIRSEPITVEIRTGRRGYAAGENILLYAEIENNSRQVLISIRVYLIQTVTFRAGRKIRRTQARLIGIDREPIASYSTAVWNTDNLIVPRDLPPSSNSANIQIKYTVALVLEHVRRGRCSGSGNGYTLSVPVTIGTVPLDRQFINQYLTSSIAAAAAGVTAASPTEAAAEEGKGERPTVETGASNDDTTQAIPSVAVRQLLKKRLLSDNDLINLTNSFQNLDGRIARGRRSFATVEQLKLSPDSTDSKAFGPRRGSVPVSKVNSLTAGIGK